jgi:hypothetical protein
MQSVASPAPAVSIPAALAAFDPRRLARLEMENWVAYYQRRWLRLLVVSVSMVAEAFHLPLHKALYGAYLVARAELAAAPFPDNDIPAAEAWMRRLYTLLKAHHRLELDPAEAARLEVNWWVVHRRLFANPDNGELAQALLDLYTQVYRLPSEAAGTAARHRAAAMLISDRWINAGKRSGDPLLEAEERELYLGYAALKAALPGGVETA